MKRAVSIPYEPKNLAEVSFIRPILIVLLVVYHAFIIFRGVDSTNWFSGKYDLLMDSRNVV